VIVSVGCVCNMPETCLQTRRIRLPAPRPPPDLPHPNSHVKPRVTDFAASKSLFARISVREEGAGLQSGGMRLTPTERDRLLLFSAAELARARRRRGLQLNVPEATALIADTAAEAARDGRRLVEAADLARSVLTAKDVLPGVTDLVTEVKVEAVFDDGTRLVVIRDPFRLDSEPSGRPTLIPGEVMPASTDARHIPAAITLSVRNLADVPISITSHFHFFEVNPRLQFDRRAAYGMRLAIPAGTALRFDPDSETPAPLIAIGGERVAVGFAGLVDGRLDDDSVRQLAYQRAEAQGYAGMDT
jgi:urease subunit gamma/beta